MSRLINELMEDFGFVKPDGLGGKIFDKEQFKTKIEQSAMMDEVETVTFGLESEDGHIVKVYVKADQADDFEEALSTMLGQEDVIEDVLNILSKDYEIVDVEWPEQDQTQGEEEAGLDPMADEDENAMDTDGSESMNSLAWDAVGDEKGKDKDKLKIKQNGEEEVDQTVQDRESPTVKVKTDNADNGEEEVPPPDDEDEDEAVEGEDEFELDDNGDKVKKKKKGKGKKKAGAEEAPHDGEETHKVKQESLTYGQRITARLLQVESKNTIQGIEDDMISIARGEKTCDDCEAAYQVAYDYYIKAGTMPYGVAKAKSGDPYDWVALQLKKDYERNQLEDILAYVDENQQDKKLREANTMKMKINEFASKKDAAAEKEAAETVEPKEKEKHLLDSRLRRPLEKMIYMAILNLGVPDVALAKSSFKQVIIDSIREKSNELMRDSKRRQALAWFLSRTMQEDVEEDAFDGLEGFSQLSEESAADTMMEFITDMMKFFDPTADKSLAERVLDSQQFKAYVTRTRSNMSRLAGSTIRTRVAAVKTAMDQVAARYAKPGATPAVAGIGVSESSPEDSEVMDQDADVATAERESPGVKKYEGPAGVSVAWGVSKDGENILLVAEAGGKRVVQIHFDAENAEELSKAFANNSVVVVRDIDQPKTKYTFSPRAGKYMVRKVGDDAKRSFIMSHKDIDGFQDFMTGELS